jgi:Vta1 like
MSLDDVAAKYKEAKMLPKYRDLITEVGSEFQKFGFFCMVKIMDDLVKISKATNDETLRPIIIKIKAVTEDYKKRFGAKFEEDKEDFMTYVVEFFAKADNEVRTGTANPLTIKKLISASNMIELLTVFGPLTSETEKRRVYAKKVATKLKKNFDETGDVNKGSQALPGAGGATAQQGGASQNQYSGVSGETAKGSQTMGGYQAPQPGYQAPGNYQAQQPAPVFDSPKMQYNPVPQPQYGAYGNPMSDAIPDEGPARGPLPKMGIPKSHNFGSSINSHEKTILDQLMNVRTGKIKENVNGLFKVEVKQVHQNTGAPGQVSFMNSALYINNRHEFERRSFQIQDELKNCMGTLNMDLATSYASLCKMKQMMLNMIQH